jgi:hypothetical protein
MEFLSEDPTFLAGSLGLIAAALFIVLRLTQQGKFLIWALAALALAALVLIVEWLWVTDNERLEYVVYDLGRAVARSDGTAVLDLLTPDVEFVAEGVAMPGEVTRTMIRSRIKSAKFDFLRINELRTNAGGQSRRGTAEFRVLAGGSIDGPTNSQNFGTLSSSWSLGFRETSPGVWRVNRITPIAGPGLQAIISATQPAPYRMPGRPFNRGRGARPAR